MMRSLRVALAEILLPIAALLGTTILVFGDGWTRMHSLVIGGGNAVTPSDVNGTMWFYWWVSQALDRNADIVVPDVICAPTGQALGSNFPQHIDALMAAPFMANLPTPMAFNLFVCLIPVLGGLAAFLAARWLSVGWVGAMLVAVLFGFNSLSIHELANGKPPSAMMFTMPLFVGAWIKSLTVEGPKSWAWMIGAGLAAALAIQHYVLYALILAFFGAGSLLLFALRPAPGQTWRRALVAGLVVLSTGVLVASPYLSQLLSERRPMPAASTLRITDPAVVREAKESIDVGYLFGVDEGESLPRRAAFPTVLTLAAILLIPFGGRRARRWIAAGLGFYLLSLGPMAAISVRPEVEWMTIAGRGVPLPTWWLNQIFPFSIQFFHPCRVFPMVVLCMGMGVAHGLGHLGRRGGQALIAPVLSALTAAVGMWQVNQQGGLHLLTAAWTPHAFFSTLAEAEEPGALLEFPVGLGHATAPFQLVHGWDRSESHHDTIAGLKANQRPEDCFQLPIFDDLWAMSRGDTSALPSAEDLQEARAAGFQYLVVYRAGFDVLNQAGIDVDREMSIRALARALGEPQINDDTLVVFALGDDA